MNSKNIKKIVGLVLVILIVMVGTTYAFFTYERNGTENRLITGNIYLHLDQNTDSINLVNQFPMTKTKARTKTDNTVTFTVTGYTTYHDPIYYEIDLLRGYELEGTRIEDKFLKFDLTDENGVYILEDVSFKDLTNKRIFVDTVSDTDGEIERQYTLRMWISDEIEISDTDYFADYNTTEWNEVYGTVRIQAIGSMDERSVSFPKPFLRFGDKSDFEFWSSEIESVKANINEVTFMKLSDEEIDIRYNAAQIKSDLTDNTTRTIVSTPKVKAWLESDPSISGQYKMYVASSEEIVFPENCSCMFCDFTSLKNITFNNIDTSKTLDMSAMFMASSAMEVLDLGNFDTRHVTNMSSMFGTMGSSNIREINLSSFDTRNVTSMGTMFAWCSSLVNLDLSTFNTKNVVNMSNMFMSCEKLEKLDLSKFDTRSVSGEGLSNMFIYCSSLTSLDVSNFYIGNVKTLIRMFYGCSSLTSLDLSKWNTSNVIDMYCMFGRCTSLTSLDLSGWDTSNVINMYGMFAGNNYVGDMKLTEIKGIENFNTSKVTDMTCMFYGMGAIENLDISKWDVSKVESFNHMFCDNFKLKSLDLSKWNVKSVKTMYDMFDDCYKLTTIGDISNWNTISLLDVGGMFNGCTSFVGNNGTLDLSGWNTSNLQATGEMFRGVKLEVIDLSGWVLSSMTNTKLPTSGIYYENGNASSYPGMNGMFLDCSLLTKVYVGSGWSIPSSVTTTNMFKNAGVSSVTVKP